MPNRFEPVCSVGIEKECSSEAPVKAPITDTIFSHPAIIADNLGGFTEYLLGEWVEQSVVATMFGVDVKQLYDNRFGRALANLQPILAEAWVELISRAVSQEKIDLGVLHWDTTSIYLEGEYKKSDLASYGHSSEGRSDHKQVKTGLDVTSRERIPLLYRLLAGRRADITTPVPNLVSIAAFLDRPECAALATRPLVVGDCKPVLSLPK